MILYIEAPDVKEKEGKYFTLGYLLPRSTRKIFIESILPVNSPAISNTEAPNASRFKLRIIQKREDWSNNYEDYQTVEKTIEFEDGKRRTFSEGSAVGNVLSAVGAGGTVGGLVGMGVGTSVGAVGGTVAGPVGGAIGGVIGAAIGGVVGAAIS